MQIKDKLNFSTKERPVTFAPQDSVQKALDVMCKKNIGSIIIINQDETIAGIVTERDMMIRVLGKKIDTEKTPLSKIMSYDVKVATQSDDLIDWLQTMSNERFRHLPIVDDQGKLINMMSQGDFVAHTWPDLQEKSKRGISGEIARPFQILLAAFTILTIGLVISGM